ncbi:MAG TPA: MBL fold metallo-hydrolase [Dehalococcoidia bacterium]|nr:MBL fold metallo-hydrolase [Dehalococcoidia bacterium]
MKQISPNVYVETGKRGCNHSFLTTLEGIVMIDAPYMPVDAESWRKVIAQKGPVKYLIQAEHHPDHIAGNGFFEGTVVSLEGTRQDFADSVVLAREGIAQAQPASLPLWESHPPRPPAITFSDKLTLYVGHHTIQLTHLIGHSANQVAVFVPEERVVFTADNMFNNRQPFLHQAYPFRWLQSLKVIAALNVHLIVPGHGDVCDRSYVKEVSRFLEDWIEAVREAIKRGLSREEVASSVSFLGRYPMNPGRESFGPELQRMNAGRLYDVLTQGEENLLKARK